ncbi:FAD-dependent oxidoreductase [Streptomyces sp. Y1]|uniref:FAD-dependent oxidoreductase n=1 Tax=Streptomyces sp. Y1 TaxID=3238634 RepID=A0AB39TTM9_9ACTN
MSRIVIVGNGPAGYRLAQLLGARAPESDITVLGEEREPAYNRVLLTDVVAGRLAAERTHLTPLDRAGVRVRTGVAAVGIDRHRRVVRAADGSLHPYDHLVLATGARSFLPPVSGLVGADGALAPRAVAVRTLADGRRLERLLREGGRAVVLGGGVLGVEIARALTERDCKVDVVHRGPHVMDGQLGPDAGRVLSSVLERFGIRVLAGRTATAWTGDRLELDDGTELPADLLVVSAGAVPEVELARRAGLRVGRGIVVDAYLCTEDPRIRALGDCAEVEGRVSGLVAPAWEQAEVLAGVLAEAPAGGDLAGEVPAGGGGRGYAGTPALTRLKARDVDLVVLGEGDREVPGSEVVTVADAARGRYARMSVRGDRVVGAVLLGFPGCVAAVSQLFDAAAPVPADRIALLVGAGAVDGTADPAALPGQAVVCRCNNVTKNDLVAAWRAGARERSALVRATRATTGCGGCGDAVADLCRWLGAADGEARPEPMRPALAR